MKRLLFDAFLSYIEYIECTVHSRIEFIMDIGPLFCFERLRSSWLVVQEHEWRALHVHRGYIQLSCQFIEGTG